MNIDLARLGRLWPHLAPHRRALWASLTLIPIVAALQALPPFLIGRAVDLGIIKGDFGTLSRYAAAYAAVLCVEYLARTGQAVAAAWAVHRMILTLRRTLIRHVLRLPSAFHDQHLSGNLVTRATGDFDNLSESLNMGVLTSVVDIAVLVGCVIGMLTLNWRLALAILVVLPLVAWTVRWFAKALKTAMLQARSKASAVNAFTQECFAGLSTVKSLTAERAAASRHEGLCREFRDAQMSSVILDALMFAVLDGISAVTTGLVLWLAAGASVGSAVTAGVLVGLVQYVQQLFEPLKQLGNKMAMLQGAFASLERINSIMETKVAMTGDVAVNALQGGVRLENVTFRYGKDKEHAPTLDGVSLSLQPGQSLALVGPTGGGKSTIVKLIAKLYDGYDGRIFLDEMDLRHIDPWSLRQRIAFVPQDVALFVGTVADNIAMFDSRISRDAIAQAIRLTGADRFIDKLPGRLDFKVQERGNNLSLGERQLITLARALARDPSLVILDEATSAVDPESEALIQEAIGVLFQRRTVIVVAHRLSTVEKCDQIFFIDRGRVAESGSHATLMASRGRYFALNQAAPA